MKTHITVQQLIVLLFGLSLAALTAYIRQHCFSAYSTSEDHRLLLSELIDARRQNGMFDNDTLPQHMPLGASEGEASTLPLLSSHALVDTFIQFVQHNLSIQPPHRRVQVRQWHKIAMTITQLPASNYQQTISTHRLGGWKETNIQFRSISQHT